MREILDKVYNASSERERQRLYDAWADSYEDDLFSMGYRSPIVAAAVFARFVKPGTTPILDAGCGGGIQVEPLAALGYREITGFDLSDGMLAIARSKGIYAHLDNMALGNGLSYPAKTFAAVISVGAITPGHAPPSSYADLIAVCKPGARIVFTLRSDAGVDAAYRDACQRLEQSGAWTSLFSSAEFAAMPKGEPDVLSRVHVFQVT